MTDWKNKEGVKCAFLIIFILLIIVIASLISSLIIDTFIKPSEPKNVGVFK